MPVTITMAGVSEYDSQMLRLKRQLAADGNTDLAAIVLGKNGNVISAHVQVSKSKFEFRMGIRQLQDDFFGTYDFLVQKIKAVAQ
jgi:hypothetical protein